MKIVRQSWSWNQRPNGIEMLKQIEIAGRTCYKREELISDDTADKFVRKMLKSGHHAMIEFAVPPAVKVITDRGITHEIVRHRLFSFAQESTRYCNYSKDRFGDKITIIEPIWFYEVDRDYKNAHGGLDNIKTSFANLQKDIRNSDISDRASQYTKWFIAMELAEALYLGLLATGQSPQEARSVLPNSLKTEINICGNVREWRHFFALRCSNKAHPQMQELARSMLNGFQHEIPVIFDDIRY